MAHSIYGRVQALIEETNDAFQSCDGCVNTDYAGFASMAISEFKTALQTPDLRRRDLVRMLRKSMSQVRADDPMRWSALMAQQLKKAANKTHH